jgi:hypothetical protein
MKDPFRRHKVNTPEQRMIYLAGWFRGIANRYGIPIAKEKLEAHPEKEEIRKMMRKIR